MKVTIITPTYNHEAFINECIESVVAQTYNNWEQVIVDDGSTDGTWEIVSRWAEKDERIKVVRREHKGIWQLGSLYNLALERSPGELVAILEGDDRWPSGKLLLQVHHHTIDHEVIMSCGDSEYVINNTHRPNLFKSSFRGIISTTEYLRLLLTVSAGYEPVTMAFRRDALDAIGGFQQSEMFPAVDYTTILEICKLRGKIEWIDRILGFYRQHETQVTRSMGVELAEGRLGLSLLTLKNLPEHRRRAIEISEREIVLAHRELLANAYLSRTRNDLITKNAMDLRQTIPKLWKTGSIKRKCQAVYSCFAIRLGWTMEPILDFVSNIIDLLHRRRYKAHGSTNLLP